MSYSSRSGAEHRKKSAKEKVIFEQSCSTLIHLYLDKTRQLQFTRFLSKGPRINVGIRPRLFSQQPWMPKAMILSNETISSDLSVSTAKLQQPL